jgi:hypothetical protein
MFSSYAAARRWDSAEASKSLVDQLVLEELLVQEADKQKLADDAQDQAAVGHGSAQPASEQCDPSDAERKRTQRRRR